MKDRRLDIFLEHYTQGEYCRYWMYDQNKNIESCKKIVKENSPQQVFCGGEFLKCGLEG